MRVNANAVLRSWTLLAAFGGSYAPGIINHTPTHKTFEGENIRLFRGFTTIRESFVREIKFAKSACACNCAMRALCVCDMRVPGALRMLEGHTYIIIGQEHAFRD